MTKPREIVFSNSDFFYRFSRECILVHLFFPALVRGRSDFPPIFLSDLLEQPFLFSFEIV